MNALQLILDILGFLLHFLPLYEDLIQLSLKFLVIVFNMLIRIFNIFRSSVGSELIKRKVVVCQLPFKLPYFIVQLLKSAFILVV